MGMNLSSFRPGQGLGTGLQNEGESVVIGFRGELTEEQRRVKSEGLARRVAPGGAADQVVGGEDGREVEGAENGEGIGKGRRGVGESERGEEVGEEFAMAVQAEDYDSGVGLLDLVERRQVLRKIENRFGYMFKFVFGLGFGFVSEHKEEEEEEKEEQSK